METPRKASPVIEFMFALVHGDPEGAEDLIKKLQAQGKLEEAAEEYCAHDGDTTNGGADYEPQ